MNKKERRSGIELLRIIAMLMIVSCHFAQHVPWTFDGLSFNHWWVKVLLSLGQTGVAIFFMITGYFMATQRSFCWKRIFVILRPLWFYSLVFTGISLVTKYLESSGWPLGQKESSLLFPFLTNAYWFIGSYIGLVLLLPFLRKWFDVLQDKEIAELLGIIVLFTCISPLINFLISSNPFALFSITLPILYALIGYAINRFEDKIECVAWSIIGAMLGGGMLLGGPIMTKVLEKISYSNIPPNLFWGLESIPCLLLSVSLFIIFSRIRFTNKLVNAVAKLMFGIYLIHSNIWMRNWLWSGKGYLNPAAHSFDGKLQFLLYSVKTVLLVFVVCAIIEFLRQQATRLFLKLCTIDREYDIMKL